jgi:hypothetical protein
VGGTKSILLNAGQRLLSALLIFLFVISASPLFAQIINDGTITSEPLEPPKPVDDADQGSSPKFIPAPFTTPEIPRQPVLIEPIDTVRQPGARMRQLDKMTGRIESFAIAAGSEVLIDRLRVRLDACRAPEDNSLHGSMAFVEIWDTKVAGSPPVFSGWMFAESPALSAMDHPRYDLWVISCTTSAGGAAAASE